MKKMIAFTLVFLHLFSCKQKVFENEQAVHDPENETAGIVLAEGNRNIMDFGVDNTGNILATSKIQQAIDQGPGQVYFPAGKYKISQLYLKAGVEIYLASGAELIGSTNPADFNWGNSTIAYIIIKDNTVANASVKGSGTLNCNASNLTNGPDGPYRQSAIKANGGSNFVLDGITIKDCASWTVNLHKMANVTINNIKIQNRTDWVHNDGIDICSCHDVTVTNCSVTNRDDAYCVKSTDAGFDSYNITFDHNYASTGAAAFKVGIQSVTKAYNIWFKNGEIATAGRALAINHEEGAGRFSDIHFVDIHASRIAAGVGALSSYPIMFSIVDRGKGVGEVNGVEITRVRIDQFGNKNSQIIGLNNANKMSNINITDLYIAGNKILNLTSGRITVNAYTSGVYFR